MGPAPVETGPQSWMDIAESLTISIMARLWWSFPWGREVSGAGEWQRMCHYILSPLPGWAFLSLSPLNSGYRSKWTHWSWDNVTFSGVRESLLSPKENSSSCPGLTGYSSGHFGATLPCPPPRWIRLDCPFCCLFIGSDYQFLQAFHKKKGKKDKSECGSNGIFEHDKPSLSG